MNTLFLKKVDGLLGSLLARVWPRPRDAGAMPEPISRLLIIRPGGIGDAALLAPLVRALRDAWPEVAIHVLAEGRNAAVFGLTPEVDAVFRYDRPKELLAVLRGRYEVVVDTEQWHRLSALLARLIRPQRLVGFATNDRRRLLSDRVDYAQDDYEVDSFLHLLGPLELDGEGRGAPPFLQVPAAARQRAEDWLSAGDGRRVVLFPGASIPERRWGTGRFAELAARLAADGVEVVVVGGREDRDAAEEIIAENGGLNLAARTSLAETAAVLERCNLLVSGDSGVLHLAVGLDVPTVSLFGPGRKEKWAPRGGNHIVLDKELPCSPCTTFGYTPPCPRGGECLQQITVEEVCQAVGRGCRT